MKLDGRKISFGCLIINTAHRMSYVLLAVVALVQVILNPLQCFSSSNGRSHK